MVTHLPDIRLKTGVLPSFVRLASLVVYRKELLMAERKREIQVKFWITPEEKKDDSQENDLIKNCKHGSLSS